MAVNDLDLGLKYVVNWLMSAPEVSLYRGNIYTNCLPRSKWHPTGSGQRSQNIRVAHYEFSVVQESDNERHALYPAEDSEAGGAHSQLFSGLCILELWVMRCRDNAAKLPLGVLNFTQYLCLT